MVKLHIFCSPVFLLTSSHGPPPERVGRFAKLMSQTTSIATRKYLLEVSSVKIFFQGNTSSPNFQRAFCMQIEKVEKFLIDRRWTQNSKADPYQVGDKKSIGDVTFGLARHLSAEIVFPPFSAMR
jgi:hypothetical protein